MAGALERASKGRIKPRKARSREKRVGSREEGEEGSACPLCIGRPK